MHEPIRYDGAAEIAALFGVQPGTVDTWLSRYSPDREPEEIAKAPVVPQPDAYTGRVAGWLPGRENEFRAWHASLPGRGAGGGRPRKG
jgi:hypothetical protein